ncbi:MAG: hypothetical protein BGO49_19010 [Planctomycetales bacterium 71-10]|mgnify:CR=1 FL=1|nr:MAG: hypothetical protein BGO49_19010 [Planctomycetales bacterium 71-10]
MRFLVLNVALAVVLVFEGSGARGDVLLDFDSLPNLTMIGDTYISQGVRFNDFESRTVTYNNWLIIPSKPSWAALMGSTHVLEFVDPVDPLAPGITSYVEFDSLGLVSSLAFLDGIVVVARSFSGEVVDTVSVPPVLRGDGRQVSTWRLEGAGIHTVTFTRIANPSGPAAAGFDNLRFGTVAPLASPVPEPSSALLCSIGLVSALALRRARAHVIQ